LCDKALKRLRRACETAKMTEFYGTEDYIIMRRRDKTCRQENRL
jgi:ribosomal protein S21